MLASLPALACTPPARAESEATVRLVQAGQTERLSAYQKQVLEYNERIQRQNKAPASFPLFIRDKFDITVVADGYSETPEGAPAWHVSRAQQRVFVMQAAVSSNQSA